MRSPLARVRGQADRRIVPGHGGPPEAPGHLGGVGTPDVFMSYAREDSAFVREFDSALRARGKDVWVDWDDILPTADWRTKIHGGIEAARVFVAVLSPDFLASAVCREEVAHAVGSNKRIVPILRREIDDTAAPPELTAPNWLVCREDVDFEAFVAQFVETLETDLDWLEEHARLLVRAREWERSGRDRAFLLRGNDLRAAEGWLTRQGEHAETATPLQSEYVVASRRGASRTQRIVLVAVLAALAVALALAAFAFLQRNKAREESRAALAQALSAQSVVDRDLEPDRAFLLAVEANRIHRTARSERTLLATLDARPNLVRFLQGARSDVNALTFSDDGRLLASADGNSNVRDDAVHLWSVPDGVSLRRLEGEGAPLTTVALGPGGRLAAAGDEAGRVMLWDTRTGHRAAPVLRLPVDRTRPSVTSLAFNRDGSLLAVGGCGGDDVEGICNKGLLGVWDVRTHRRLGLRGAHTSAITSLAFSADGTLLASASGGAIFHGITTHDFSVILWAVPTWRRLGGELVRPHRVIPGGISALAFGPSGKRLAAGSLDGTFRIWNVGSHRLEHTIAHHDAPVIALAFTRDEVWVQSADSNGVIEVDAPSGGGRYPVSEVGNVASVAFSRDLRYWAAGGCRARSASGVCLSGRVSLWDERSRTRRLFRDDGTGTERAYALAYSPDGGRLAYGRDDWSGYSKHLAVHVLATSDSGAHEIAALPSGYGVASLAFSPDRRLLVGGTCVQVHAGVECTRGAIEVWDLASHRRRLVEVGRSAVDWVAVTPAGTVVAHAGRGVLLWEPGSKRLRKVVELPSGLDVVASSPDGRTLAAGGCGRAGSRSAGDLSGGYYTTTDCVQGRIDFWNLEDGKPIGSPVRAHTDSITSLAFAPDGGTVYSGSGEFDGSIRSWDARSHRELGRPIAGPAGGVEGLAVSPDGKLLASSSLQSGIAIWDLPGGEMLTEELPDSADTTGIVFDPQSTLVAASRGVLGWRLSLAALASEACGIANRNLSRAEWESYLPGPYARTCPALSEGA